MPPNPIQPLPSDSSMHSKTKAASVNSLTITPSGSGSQRESSFGRTVTTAAHSDTVHDDHCTSSQQDAGGKIIDPECITQSDDHDSQPSISEPPSPSDSPVALTRDLTGQIFGTINDYVASGAFGNVTDVNGDDGRALSRSGQWAVPA